MKRQTWIMVLAAAALFAGSALLAGAWESGALPRVSSDSMRAAVQAVWVQTARATDDVMAPAVAAVAAGLRAPSTLPSLPFAGRVLALAAALAAGCLAVILLVRRRPVTTRSRVCRLAARGEEVHSIARRTRIAQDAVRDLVRSGRPGWSRA